MNWSIDKSKITELSLEIGIPEPYIEKDIYLIEVLKVLREFNNEQFQFIFSGGTCLSKGHNLIKRFSEDIDFMVKGSDRLNRTEMSNIRKDALKRIENIGLVIEGEKSRNESRFFSCYIKYPKLYDTPMELRRDIKLEVSFLEPYLDTETKIIKSFFHDFDETAPTVAFNCLTLNETAANKVSALVWRINDDSHYDPYLMRHLYDLSMLKPLTLNDIFKTATYWAFENDKKNRIKNTEVSFKDICLETLICLKADKYANDYSKFVNNMVYKDDAKIPFEKAFTDFEEIINYLI